MALFEIAGLQNLRRLSIVRVHQLTDMAVYALSEHAIRLERLQLSYCDHLSLEAIHLLLGKLEQLQHLTATGVPAFRRPGVRRFSDPAPANIDEEAYFVFNGENVAGLCAFLDKEEGRRREAEARNIPFVMRSDDRLDLY